MMDPTWESDCGTVKLWNGDCVEVMRSWPDQSVGAVVTDPPYGVGFNYSTFNDKMTPDEWEDWAREWFPECRRVAATVLVTGQARLPQLARIEPWKWLLAWHKPAAMGRSCVGFCAWEPIAVYGAGSSAGMPDWFRAMIKGGKNYGGGHPCPKPEAWADEQIIRWPKAERIADPFTGSGTTGVAAVRHGRQFWGIELDAEYFDIAKRRILEELRAQQFLAGQLSAGPRQQNLFSAAGTQDP